MPLLRPGGVPVCGSHCAQVPGSVKAAACGTCFGLDGFRVLWYNPHDRREHPFFLPPSAARKMSYTAPRRVSAQHARGEAGRRGGEAKNTDVFFSLPQGHRRERTRRARKAPFPLVSPAFVTFSLEEHGERGKRGGAGEKRGRGATRRGTPTQRSKHRESAQRGACEADGEIPQAASANDRRRRREQTNRKAHRRVAARPSAATAGHHAPTDGGRESRRVPRTNP